MLRLLVLTLALALGVLSASAPFSANFWVQRPNNTGFVDGEILYDPANIQYIYRYAGRNYSELFKFNADFGTSDYANNDQWMYQSGQSCSGCRAGKVEFHFPIYHLTSMYTADSRPAIQNSVGQTCTSYKPVTGANTPLAALWFTASGVICRAEWKTGAVYTFSDVTTVASFDQAIFTEASDCRCTDRNDLVILIDRSASIGVNDFAEGVGFVNDFLKSFRVSPAHTNILLALFDTEVELVMELYEGISLDNVRTALNNVDCGCSDTVLPQSGVGKHSSGTSWAEKVANRHGSGSPCCLRSTSISKAINSAVSYLKSNGRPGVPPHIMVVSDGSHNTMANGSPCTSKTKCHSDLQSAVNKAYSALPGLKMYGVGMHDDEVSEFLDFISGGKKERRCSTRSYRKGEAKYIVGSFGCSPITYFCDPNTCCGLCECGECKPPSGCSDHPNYCLVSGLYGGRCCQEQIRICPQSPNRCNRTWCDIDAGSCVSEIQSCVPYQSPPTTVTFRNGTQGQIICKERACEISTGLCQIFWYPGPEATQCPDYPECSADADCLDANECTIDRCVNNRCVYVSRQCDDLNLCTEDDCVTMHGCKAIPILADNLCNDHISCTRDYCEPSSGCQNEEQSCDDGEKCTTDHCSLTLGRCVNEPILCPNTNDNCTLNYCLTGNCKRRDLCITNLEAGVVPLGGGYIALISAGSVAALGALGGVVYVIVKLKTTAVAAKHGGHVKHFVSD